jgi:16S rRNA C967 or C1407 C5-methylase (RsmB/RsmF family)/NOL1/NOP2/fmu family ribosome biogenesis protein
VNRLPEALLNSLTGLEGFNREEFINSHTPERTLTSIRINPGKLMTPEKMQILQRQLLDLWGASLNEKVAWSQWGYYLDKRPSFTFDPLFHAGCYYVQEASSMFVEQAFRQLVDLDRPLRILDLCGAPGGKSTHIQSLISDHSILFSNEVIRTRVPVLKDNQVKWGSSNVLVTNNDPAAFKKLEGWFDVIVVDAPCSGSGLFRRDEEAIEEWSLNNVTLCSQRQQRILADVLPCLKEDGLLIYSTCSFSKEENEDIADWLVEKQSMKGEKIQLQGDWGITESRSTIFKAPGYRFYPDKVKGEGFFCSCFRKTKPVESQKIRPGKMEKVTAAEKDLLQPWLEYPFEFIKEGEVFFAMPVHLLEVYATLYKTLHVAYKGIELGRILKNKLIPDHALALSTGIRNDIPAIELSYEEAIKYLQKQDISLTNASTGWQLIRYKGNNLGWVNVLPNRVNNYYPKEMRILKRDNDTFEKI